MFINAIHWRRRGEHIQDPEYSIGCPWAAGPQQGLALKPSAAGGGTASRVCRYLRRRHRQDLDGWALAFAWNSSY